MIEVFIIDLLHFKLLIFLSFHSSLLHRSPKSIGTIIGEPLGVIIEFHFPSSAFPSPSDVTGERDDVTVGRRTEKEYKGKRIVNNRMVECSFVCFKDGGH